MCPPSPVTLGVMSAVGCRALGPTPRLWDPNLLAGAFGAAVFNEPGRFWPLLWSGDDSSVWTPSGRRTQPAGLGRWAGR